MSSGYHGSRGWRTSLLVAGVLAQLGITGLGRVAAQMPDGPPAVISGSADPKVEAQGKLLRARAQLGQGNLDAADAVVAELSAQGLTFGPNEDSPVKLLADLEKARKDPRAMLQASRAALGRREYDRAERYARSAEKGATMFTFSAWGDTPTKALKDIDTARKNAPTATAATSSTSSNPSSPPPAAFDETARDMVKKARAALTAGKVDEARALAAEAIKLKPNLGWWDDSPEKVLADAAKLQEGPKPAAAADMTPPATKADAQKVLTDGRKALADGKLDDATAAAKLAKSSAGVTWGLFEDTPDALVRDVEKAKGLRDRKEADGLLVEGRKALARGDHEAAARLANRSHQLFSGYSTWDMGDRPSKLLADCQSAKARDAGASAKPTAVVAKPDRAAPPVPGASPLPAPTPNVTALTAPPAGVPTELATPPAAKLRAEQLVAEAMRLQAEGKLVEAKAKASEAMKQKAVFGPEETSPELVFQAISTDARRKIEELNAASKPDEAKALAMAFGQDAGTSDVPPPPPGMGAPGAVTTVGHTAEVVPAANLLDNARAELKKGEVGTARKMAEEALKGDAATQEQAMSLLRTIDAEEFNQKKLTANRSFDAAEAAYRRREYAQAGAMLSAVDPKLLDATRQAHLREINLTPEMNPSATKAMPGKAVATDAKPGDGPELVRTGGTDGPGKATATDAEPSLQDEYKQRQTALFQMMRSQGLDALNQAKEKFTTGQYEAALLVLQDQIEAIRNEKLEPAQAAMLRRPVEARLQLYRLQKTQKEMIAGLGASKRTVEGRLEAQRKAEELKKKNIEDLMRQFNAKFQAKDWAGSMALASRMKDIDPDNPVVTAALQLTKTQNNRKEFNDLKDERGELNRLALNDAEHMQGGAALKDGVAFDKERWEVARKREAWGGTKVGKTGAKAREIEAKLLAPVSLNFEHTPLSQVIDDLREFHQLNINPDYAALQKEGIDLSSPIKVKVENISLKSTLNYILSQVRLTYVIKDEMLLITTEENSKGAHTTVTYQVADLVVPMEQHPATPISTGAPPNVGGANPIQYTPTPTTGPSTLVGGTAVGSPNGGAVSTSGQVVKKNVSNTQEEVLIKMITSSIVPKSWSDVGGSGTIEYYPITHGLIVNQTPDIQEQISDLLTALRRLQDQSVAIEVRLITVTEDFFERIGVNFAMNILTDKANRSFEPQLLNGNFVSDTSRFINAFDPKRFIAGLTPAGTLTPTLDIPITQQSFYQTFPPFGNYTGGGLNIGLAFLSDIQVFLMLEALQGDVRSNVMQAPKITCANGQTATVSINDQQNIVNGVQVVGLPGGQFAFQPTIGQSPNGGNISLSVQPLITDDRRFVRVSLTPTLANAAPGPIPVFPIVVPLFTNVDGVQTGQPVVFTQYIQLPRVTTLSVQTEVRIPDGGTVVMGGLKRMAEARTEFGPPVLSKIPYVNRLFKNVGYGKETESLLMMVTARIIVLSEEQERATGFSTYPSGDAGRP